MRLILPLILLAGCPSPAPPEVSAPAPEPAKPSLTMRESKGSEQDLKDTMAFFETRPVVERVLDPGLVPVQGVGARSAQVCGACHQEIYREWALSTHRHAWNDPQFQAEIGKSDNTWLCRNCHTPTLLQQPVWPVGLVQGDVEAPILVENPRYDAALEDEGITCVACHVRDGVIHGPGLPDSAAPHPVVASDQYRSGALCERCHQAEQVYPGKGFICTFSTGVEWRESPQYRDGKTCVTCHMPEVERPVAVGGPVRTVRRHWFSGSGIPKFADQAPPADAPPGPGLALSGAVRGDKLVLEAKNAHAGHYLPSGDPERWVQIDVRFVDAAGGPVGEPWSYRIGQEWEWHPLPKKLGENRLKAGEARSLEIGIPAGAARAEVSASNHRMTKKIADYHDLGEYPLSVPTHRFEVDIASR